MTFCMGSRAGRVVLLLGTLALLAPAAAWAHSVIYHCPDATAETCFDNTDGTISQTGTGLNHAILSLSGSTVTNIGWYTGTADNAGTLTFSTGVLTAGSLPGATCVAGNCTPNGIGGTFSSVGSSFVLNGSYNGTSGVIFNGAFTGNITWTLVGDCTTTTMCTYDLSGKIAGTWNPNGVGAVTGATVQLYFTTKGPYAGGKQAITDVGGVSYVDTPVVGSPVPEPGSLGLLGTGLIGVGVAAKRRLTGKG